MTFDRPGRVVLAEDDEDVRTALASLLRNEGYEVLDKIRQVATGNSRGHQDVPVKPVTIVAVRRA